MYFFIRSSVLILILTGCASSPISTENSIKILFVGNSLSYTHNLPDILTQIGKIQSRDILTECLCKPNYALVDHWNEDALQNKIKKKDYDFVILQQGPSSQELGRQVLIEYGHKIVELAKKQNIKAMFYMVWPSVSYYHTFDGVIESYAIAAKETDALLAPVGQVWKAYELEREGNGLYGPDLFHPSEKGAFLAAWVIYHSLYPDSSTTYKQAYSKYITKDEFGLIAEKFLLVSNS